MGGGLGGATDAGSGCWPIIRRMDVMWRFIIAVCPTINQYICGDILAELTFNKVYNKHKLTRKLHNVNSGKFKIATRKVNHCAYSSVRLILLAFAN